MASCHDLALTWRGGREETVPADEDETVLEAAESAGVAIPFGCRTGACGTCAGRLVEGDASHRRPPRALRSGHLRDGYVLCCIATPETDCRVEVGADVHARLVSNPWK